MSVWVSCTRSASPTSAPSNPFTSRPSATGWRMRTHTPLSEAPVTRASNCWPMRGSSSMAAAHLRTRRSTFAALPSCSVQCASRLRVPGLHGGGGDREVFEELFRSCVLVGAGGRESCAVVDRPRLAGALSRRALLVPHALEQLCCAVPGPQLSLYASDRGGAR